MAQVVWEMRGKVGEGRENFSEEKLFPPFPKPHPSPSKTFDLIESLFPAFAGNGEAFFEMDSKHSGYPADTRGAAVTSPDGTGMG